MLTLDPDQLRTFLAFAETGSLARAAAVVNRSPSAVSTQMQKLEDHLGEPLLAPEGRGRVLTAAGQELVGHARRILDAHAQAWLSFKGARAEGSVTIAATQDFAESGLPELLALFGRTHPRTRLELRIGRSIEIAEALAAGSVDVGITMRAEPTPDEIATISEETVWWAAAGGLSTTQDEVALALLDPPCGFRARALDALDRAGRHYRIAATSQSLAGLRTAVLAGLAVTLRTARWKGPGLAKAEAALALPETEPVTFAVRLRRGAQPPAGRLAELLADGLPRS
jgi:DNA-binding transcriptional LysR family regulator